MGRWVYVPALCLALSAASALAQDESTGQSRTAAAEAYDRASAAYLARNYEQAARWFETAHRLAPAAPALIQAIRSHHRARNELRAATLALQLRDQYPDVHTADRTVLPLLRDAEQSLFRVDVQCDGCSVLLDGALLDGMSFFLEPGTTHAVIAHFEGGDVEAEVSGAADERRELAFESPPEVRPETGTQSGTGRQESSEAGTDPRQGRADPSASRDEGSAGLSPVWVLVGAGVTAALGGVLIWSGLDAVAGVDGYEAEAATGDPMVAQQLLEDGQARELRTNVLIGATAGAAAVTAILLLLTSWGGEDADGPRVSAGGGPGALSVNLSGDL